MSTEPLSLWPVERISLGLPAGSKQDVLSALVAMVASELSLTGPARKRMLDALLAREKTGSTAMNSIAIPHVKSPDVARSCAALGVFTEGIDYGAVDGELVHAVFLIASPAKLAAEHLETLRWIAGIARKPDFIHFLRRTKSPQEARALLEEMGT